MMWTKKLPETKPSVGDTRDVRKFLFWPKTIGRETRWLEWAIWTEEYTEFECKITYRPTQVVLETWREFEWVSKGWVPRGMEHIR